MSENDTPGANLGNSSDGFIELEDRPKRTVVGASYITVILARIFIVLGSARHLIIRWDKVLLRFDSVIHNAITP